MNSLNSLKGVLKSNMYIPYEINQFIQNKPYTIDSTGMSGSTILIFEDEVLKIQPYTKEVATEIQMMEWLEGKANVPKVICHAVEEDTSYLLMSKMQGMMSCDIQYLENSDILVHLLVSGMKALWNVDIKECPVNWNLKNKLELAKGRVLNNLVDVDHCDPHTFGEDGFASPLDLYQWLETHQPQEELVLSHGDYCLPNIFGLENEFSGFIDIGHMGIADKWQDIALCYRSLRDNMNGSYGGKVYDFNPDILFEKLGIEKDLEKLNYYLLLDELF